LQVYLGSSDTRDRLFWQLHFRYLYSSEFLFVWRGGAESASEDRTRSPEVSGHFVACALLPRRQAGRSDLRAPKCPETSGREGACVPQDADSAPPRQSFLKLFSIPDQAFLCAKIFNPSFYYYICQSRHLGYPRCVILQQLRLLLFLKNKKEILLFSPCGTPYGDEGAHKQNEITYF